MSGSRWRYLQRLCSGGWRSTSGRTGFAKKLSTNYLVNQNFNGLNGTQFSIEVTNGAVAPGNPVPEPESLALFGLALAAVALVCRRQLRK